MRQVLLHFLVWVNFSFSNIFNNATHIRKMYKHIKFCKTCVSMDIYLNLNKLLVNRNCAPYFVFLVLLKTFHAVYMIFFQFFVLFLIKFWHNHDTLIRFDHSIILLFFLYFFSCVAKTKIKIVFFIKRFRHNKIIPSVTVILHI